MRGDLGSCGSSLSLSCVSALAGGLSGSVNYENLLTKQVFIVSRDHLLLNLTSKQR